MLEFKTEPRWFLGFPKAVTQAEFEAWIKSQSGKSQIQTPNEPSFQIPNPPRYAGAFDDIPVANQGATLKFAVTRPQKEGELAFSLTLAAGERAIRREIEHRNTNVVPFLFAFRADGKAVTRELDGTSNEGGTNRLVELVSAKSRQDWQLRVSTKSLNQLLPEDTHKLEIVAAFSERQHQGYAGEGQSDSLESWNLKDLPPQILIRSNVVRLIRTGDHWASDAAR